LRAFERGWRPFADEDANVGASIHLERLMMGEVIGELMEKIL
jgi:hypothetical protein